MLNPDAVVQLRRVGREQTPVLVIDDLLADPETLVGFAKKASWHPPQGTYYPGLNAELPAAYMDAVGGRLRMTFERAFGGARDGQSTGFLALATWGLDQFGPWQRIPHYDHAETGPLAMVHYLGRQNHGGTAFFRHRATGFESVDAARRNDYWRHVEAEQNSPHSPPPAYIDGDTPLYEQTARQDGVFNRLLLYRRNMLHSGALPANFIPDPDPRRGRLSLNGFLAI